MRRLSFGFVAPLLGLLFAGPALGADLAVESLTYSPPSPGEGESVTLTAIVGNHGATPINVASWMEFARYTGGSRAVISQEYRSGSIPAGGTITLQTTWVAELADSLEFAADIYDWINETDENNNRLAVPISFVEPDLVITSLRAAPAGPLAGGAVDLVATVANVTEGSRSSTVEVCVSVDGTLVECVTIPPVPGLGEAEARITSWVPTAGAHVLYAVVDSVGLWDEEDETNNHATGAVTVLPTDLQVEDISWDPPNPSEGDTVTIVAQMVNRGTGGHVADFDVALRIDGIPQDTRRITSDAGAGQTADAFPNAGFESGGFAGWVDSTGWSIVAAAGELDSLSHRFHAEASSGGAVLVSAPFTVTDPTFSFRGIGHSVSNPGLFEVLHNGQVVASHDVDQISGAFGWPVRTLDLSGYVDSTVTVRVTTSAAGASLDEIRMGPDSTAVMPVSQASFSWVVLPGDHDLEVSVDSGLEVPEENESNNMRVESMIQGPADYVITALRPATYNLVAGRTSGIVATVSNLGVSKSQSSSVCVTVNGLLASCESVQGLDNGEEREVLLEGWVPSPGFQTIVALADGLGELEESDETNNELSLEVFVELPDLFVSDIFWSPTDPAAGDSVTVYAEIRNQSSGGSALPFEVTLSSPLGSSKVIVEHDASPANLASAFPNAQFEDGTLGGWTPGGWLENGWTIGSHASDPDSATATYYAEGIDLGTNLVSPPFVVTDSTLFVRGATRFNYQNIRIEVRNTVGALLAEHQFSSPANYDWQEHMIDISPWMGDSVEVTVYAGSGGCRLDALRMGGSPGSSFVAAVPIWTWPASTANPNLSVEVDAAFAIPETQEGNNLRQETIAPGMADYVVADLRLSPVDQLAGRNQKILATLRNDGAGTSGATSLCLSVDGTPVECMSIPGMSSGEEIAVQFTSWTATPGSHQLTVVADSTDFYPESNETNNIISTTAIVELPDLAIRDIFWSPSHPDSGDTVTFFAEVENLGPGGNAANYLVRITVDVNGVSSTIQDDIGFGQRAGAFPGSGLESGDLSGWDRTGTWSVGTHTLDPSSPNRFHAGTTVNGDTLESAPFVATDPTLSFRGASGINIWPGTISVHRVDGSLVTSASFTSSSSGSWSWMSSSLDLSSVVDSTVFVRVVSGPGGARIDDIRMEDDPTATTVVAVGTRTWVATEGTHSISAFVDGNNDIQELNEDNNTLTRSMVNTLSVCAPSQSQAWPDSTIDIPFVIGGSGLPPMSQFGFDIVFDDHVMEVESLELGGFTQDWTLQTTPVNSQTLRVDLTANGGAETPSPGESVVVVRFHIMPWANGDAGVGTENMTGDLAGAVSCAGEVQFLGDVTGIGDGILGYRLALGPNVPNPFRSATTIHFTVPEGTSRDVSIEVFDVQGRLIRRLVDAPYGPGDHQVRWSGDSDRGAMVSPGIYFYRMRAGSFAATRKALLVR